MNEDSFRIFVVYSTKAPVGLEIESGYELRDRKWKDKGRNKPRGIYMLIR
jgi:hypothetical protein